MYRVYGDLYSGNCYKVKLALHQTGQLYEWTHVDVTKAETRTPEFLALNPNGKIPLLVFDDGRMLPESNAILNFLADGSPLLPTDRWERALVLQWMFFEQYTHEPSVAVARYIVRYLERPPEREARLQETLKSGAKALGVMEAHLAKNEFFAAGRYTIADIALYAYTHVAEEGLFDLGAYPNIRTWLARVKSQPDYVAMDG